MLQSERIVQAKIDLAVRGFTSMVDVFNPEAVADVEQLIGDAIRHAQNSTGRTRRRHLVVYPELCSKMSPSADGHWDQIEINFTSELEPKLLETEVYRSCIALARRISSRATLSFDHAILKGADNSTDTPWHQDAAFSMFPGLVGSKLNFWIPLQDTTVEHGCMEFIVNSHLQPLRRHERSLRTSGQPGRSTTPRPDDLRACCPLGAGSVTIHTPYTLHRAGRNMTCETRKAWIVQFSTGPGTTLMAHGLRRVRAALSL